MIRRAIALQRGRSIHVLQRRTKADVAPPSAPSVFFHDQPSRQQLRRVFLSAAIPFVGFGFVDQTVMLQAGNAIDCTLGVTFGLSTLSSAAFGQICSDACGVLFGGTLESLFHSLGMPKANLSAKQLNLPIVRRVRLGGSLFGVVAGCCLGLLNLLFIDTSRSTSLKLQNFDTDHEFQFEIVASNSERPDATTLKVRGPDTDGILASMTAALAVSGCSLLELHATRDKDTNRIVDVFTVVHTKTHQPFDDDELEELAQNLLSATRSPMNVQATILDLKQTNQRLGERVEVLERATRERQIKVVRSFETNS